MGNFIHKISPSDHDIRGASTQVKEQAQARSSNEVYQLVQPPTNYQQEGRGILVDEAAKCFQKKNYQPLHKKIREKINEYLYNDGNCEDIPIKTLVNKRNEERKKKIKEQKQSFGIKSFFYNNPKPPVELDNIERSQNKRKCCWKIDQRGALGETALHICLLNNTKIHNLLAMEMIKLYPNLIHDIYIGDEYYGESVLHMAIANENEEMVTFILKEGKKIGINLKERCFGKFFSPQDQVLTRFDRENVEEVGVNLNTNYKGLVYWGEYALSFAVCSNQKSIVKLLLDARADIFAEDTNGNNVLHMAVIHNNKDMFEYCYNAAGEKKRSLLEAKNKQGLTPLTISAKLAKKEMLDYILELKREIVWEFGDVTCAHYPLTDVDTIEPSSGKINTLSALNIILNADSNEHLSMLNGLLYQLLHEKWKEYAKVRFYQKAFLFVVYLMFFVTAIYLQPTPPQDSDTVLFNSCYLLAPSDAQQIARFVLEILTVIGALLYLTFLTWNIYEEGWTSFGHTIWNAPTRGSFHFSCILVVAAIPCRFTCSVISENIILTLAIFTGIPYLFFFCRGFKFVGPFVVAVYKMIKGDLVRFFILYFIFLLGFSQAMFIVFRGTNHPLFGYPVLSILGMFIITLGEFADLYASFDSTANPTAAKILFVVYLFISTVLLINVLIAMMGNTFARIADTKWEWQRQWAKIVLVIEQSVSPEYRKKKQIRYSIDENGERCFVIRKFNEKKEQAKDK